MYIHIERFRYCRERKLVESLRKFLGKGWKDEIDEMDEEKRGNGERKFKGIERKGEIVLK